MSGPHNCSSLERTNTAFLDISSALVLSPSCSAARAAMAHARHSDSRCSLRANLSCALVANVSAVCGSFAFKAVSPQRRSATEYRLKLPEFDETSIASSHNCLASFFPPETLFIKARKYLLSIRPSDLAGADLTASSAETVACARFPSLKLNSALTS